jgi:uncharacterized protein
VTDSAGRAPGRPKPARTPPGGHSPYSVSGGSHSVWLLDANLLIALTHAAHIHHTEAHAWFSAHPKRRWATCALTQLAFVRLTSNPKIVGSEITPAQAMQAVETMVAQPQHEYWPDGQEPLQMATLQSPALVGHRQVTDAYLLGLAVHHQQRLATLDRGLVSFALACGLAAHAELVSARPMVQEQAAAYKVKRSKR